MNGSEQESRPGGPDRIEQLLRNTEARERPSAADEQAIRETLHGEWQATVRRRRWRQIGWAGSGVVAALVLVVVALQRPGPVPHAGVDAVQLARVETTTGRARIQSGGDIGFATGQTGTALHAGQAIETVGTARLALRWRDGSSVRIDERTAVRLTPEGEVELVRGRVYVDAGASTAASQAPVILTPAGPVRHLGTQYMVSVKGVSVEGAKMDAGATRISVREGRVALTAGGMQSTASSGEELSVGPDGQRHRRSISVWGEDWRWAESLAAPYAGNGRSMAEFLTWVGRETGRRIEFASAAAEQLAGETELRGAIELEPMRALELALQTSNLTHIVDNGVIRVRKRTDE